MRSASASSLVSYILCTAASALYSLAYSRFYCKKNKLFLGQTSLLSLKTLQIHSDVADLLSINRSGDRSVLRALDSLLKGHGFEFWWENFHLQGQLSMLTLTSVSVPPQCYCSST